ncbi:hypothetical protein K8352_02460 [Flavobacteriaceae bacterium F89]|uniref:Uncharacterized protein n=1 Tax=Cerina litoralis TaxID=2874477 RepID=A0AAE3EU11_9FLAO|nr:hypothetical protein [Cerina litoralis]MCG2459607.1 hypothetical protein [Cerina litoralis]
MKLLRFLPSILGLALILTLMGCSKSSAADDLLPDDQYYIKFKADGRPVIFANDAVTSVVIGTFSEYATNSPDMRSSGIIGTKDVKDGDNYFAIQVATVEEAKLNAPYTNYTPGGGKIKADSFISTYTKGEQVFGVVDETLYELTGDEVAKSEIKFTEVTDETIKGTFSGTWYDFDDSFIQITEGEFYVPRIKNGS